MVAEHPGSKADEDLVTRLQASLADHPEVAAAWLFGSQARGTARPDSDLDLGLLFREDPPPTLAGLRFDLRDELTEKLGRQVDLVVLNAAPVDLIHRVLRDGLLLVENDRQRRVHFEVKARREYFDLLPVLQLYRQPRRAGSPR